MGYPKNVKKIKIARPNRISKVKLFNKLQVCPCHSNNNKYRSPLSPEGVSLWHFPPEVVKISMHTFPRILPENCRKKSWNLIVINFQQGLVNFIMI